MSTSKVWWLLIAAIILAGGIHLLRDFSYQPTAPTSGDTISQAIRNFSGSPFGIHEARFYETGELAEIKNLGARSARLAPASNLIWSANEKVRGKFEWSGPDKVIGAANNAGIDTFVTVSSKREAGAAKYPDDIDWFLEYLGKAVERYDGDGMNDAPGSPKIDVIQIENEVDGKVFWDDSPQNYALLLKRSYQTIKKAAPDMKVAIAGVASPAGYYRFYLPVLEELNKIKDNPQDQYFDVFDLHWSGQFAGDNDYAVINLPDKKYELKEYVRDIRAQLSKINYKNVNLYITEMSDYDGSPKQFPFHSEAYQAGAVIKRYVYSLVSGVERIYWAQVVEQHGFSGIKNGYFDNVGLINNEKNDGQNHKKLSYYTYKKMVEILDGSDWDNIKIIKESDGVHIYQFTQPDKLIWVAWNDNPQEKQVEILGVRSSQVKITEAVPKFVSGKEVVDYNTAFSIEIRSVPKGGIVLNLKDKPLIIEENK